MPDRFGNPEKVRFKELRMVNREYDEVIKEPKKIENPINDQTVKNKKS
jgi:hypothetical protein